MAVILLAHCNHLYFDRKQVRKMQPYPPLQTLLAAACLRREGYEVTLFDCTLAYTEGAFREALALHRPRLVALCEDNFNFLTKMCLTRNRELAFSMCQAAKERGLPVLVNSSDAVRSTAWIICVMATDFVILGEVEETLLEAVASVCYCAHRAGGAGDRGPGLSRSRNANPADQPAARADRRPGLSAAAGMGLDRCAGLSGGLDCGPWLLLAEYGFEPRLSVPLQLVLEADLWERLPPSFSASRS